MITVTSRLIFSMLQHEESVFSETFDQIFLCVPNTLKNSQSTLVEKFRSISDKVQIVFDFPDFHELGLYQDNGGKHRLVILEDMMAESYASTDLMTLMSQGSHHHKIRDFFHYSTLFFLFIVLGV